jgi:hypothetical protein
LETHELLACGYIAWHCITKCHVATPSLVLSVTVTALLFSTAQHTHAHTRTHTHASFCVLNFLLAADRPNLAEWKVERACCRASLSCLQCVSFVAVPTTADSAPAVGAMIKKNPVCACRILSGFCVRCFAVVRVAVFREMEHYGDRCIRLHSCFVVFSWNLESRTGGELRDDRPTDVRRCSLSLSEQYTRVLWLMRRRVISNSLFSRKYVTLTRAILHVVLPTSADGQYQCQVLYSRAWRPVVR